ncbi:CBO0543 family protein [Mesobacillus subterraneus]|uniref:Uncharacterized protein n=1 Tax=Mesobacillus subterraneus TaxID=285983 RepID=A0A3R9EEV3_9BACI|nr:CBO0543 family protein [Mesobacillus subterraneus]RSD28817.1 hypothetical protein EJA10_04400 [Mesobacillus subterraneus]
MHFVYNALFLIAAIIWGDWKGWKKYYPTILFFFTGDLLKGVLLYNQMKWTYQESIFGQSILVNHTVIALMIMFVVYPSTILIYLGRFPSVRWKKILWVFTWVGVYTLIEHINERYLNLINHHGGWNIGWSVLFNIVMFSLLRLHFKNPLLTWGLSAIWVIFLLNAFDVQLHKMK